MHKLRIVLAVLSFLLPLAAWAQAVPDPVQYVINPAVPGPNQKVTIEAQGIGAFLGDATVTWSQDGKVAQSGTGLRTYSFTTGALGTVTRIRVGIQSQSDGSFSKDFVFRPSVVNLVWEADTSVPPLYRSKALYSAGSPLKVAAFPTVIINGARVAASSLSYQWSRGDAPLPAQSGLGRSTLSFVGDQLQPEEDVFVDVYFGGALVAQGSVAIPAAAPQVVLYERDSLRGMLYDLALPRGIALSAKELTVVAQPYYFSKPSLAAGSLQYAWTLDGQDITGPDSARGILTLRQTGSGAGQATLSATLQNNAADQLVQSAQTMLSILFRQGSGRSSFFGL